MFVANSQGSGMPDESYSVRVNRRDGIVEIAGPDKDWVADQLERLSAIYAELPPDDRKQQDGSADETNQAGTSKKKSPSVAKPRARRSGPKVPKGSELDEKLTKPVRAKLHSYQGERQPGWRSHPDQAAIIASFLADEVDVHEIGPADLVAVYRAMGWPPPRDPTGTIKNAIGRKGYFSGRRGGKVELTPTGEHFGRHASKEGAEDEK
jgi:hypothetical protein